MKRIIRLTESDLARLVRRVIKEEQDNDQNVLNAFQRKYPEVIKMAEYADNKIGSTMNRGIYSFKDKNGMYIRTSEGSSIIPMTDSDMVTFSLMNNGTTKIEYVNNLGVDPTPIPFPKTLEQFKKWFDSVGVFG